MRAPAGRGKVTPPLLLLVRSFSSVVKVVKSPKKESTTRQRGRFVSSIDTREDNNTEIAETEHEPSMMEKDKEKEEEVEELVNITLKTIGPARPSCLQLPSAIKVHELRKLVAADVNLPVEHLKLVLQGEVLHDTRNLVDVSIRLNEGDSVIVAVVPKPPAKHIRDIYDGDDNDELKFRMPQSTNRWKRRLFSFLHDKLRLPDILLMAIFPISLKAWAAILAWFTLAPVAYRLDIGPLYILATGFAIILLNLGQRKHGDLSAYSIFNDDFRELPGTLNADRLDRDIRAGQF